MRPRASNLLLNGTCGWCSLFILFDMTLNSDVYGTSSFSKVKTLRVNVQNSGNVSRLANPFRHETTSKGESRKLWKFDIFSRGKTLHLLWKLGRLKIDILMSLNLQVIVERCWNLVGRKPRLCQRIGIFTNNSSPVPWLEILGECEVMWCTKLGHLNLEKWKKDVYMNVSIFHKANFMEHVLD